MATKSLSRVRSNSSSRPKAPSAPKGLPAPQGPSPLLDDHIMKSFLLECAIRHIEGVLRRGGAIDVPYPSDELPF